MKSLAIIDHIGITVADYARAKAFYEAALAPLGLAVMMDFPGGGAACGFGRDGKPAFWISAGAKVSPPLHIAFAAPSREAVDAFYKAALAAGAADNGAPGVRKHYHPSYYGAFVLDPDGHNIEAVCHHKPAVLREAEATASRRQPMNDPAAFWDKRYSGEDYAFGTKPNEFLVSQAHRLKPGMRALVPGDGEGRNGVWLAEQGLTVDTVDASPVGVAKARKLAAERGVVVNAAVADLAAWAWPREAYDVVAVLYVHFFDHERPKLHRAMLDALKPGGLLILEAYRPEQLEMQKLYNSGGPRTADMLYSKDDLAQDFAAASILELKEQTVELAEGHRHRGLAAIIRAVVQRPE